MRNRELIGLMSLNGGIHYGNQLPGRYRIIRHLESPAYSTGSRLVESFMSWMKGLRRKISEAQ